VTEVEILPGAGQWPGEIRLKRLARYAPKNYFILGPRTWTERENRGVGSTVQEENDLLLLYHDGNPRLLSFDIEEWSLDRRPRNPSIQRRWHPAFHPETGALRPLMIALTYGAWSQRGLGLSPRLPPSLTLSVEVSFPSTLVACPGSGSLLGGELPEHNDEVLVFFILISLFS
jgi:hypothetical protein